MRGRTKYTFLHRAGGRYYWSAPSHRAGCEEIVSCDVAWFWSGGRL